MTTKALRKRTPSAGQAVEVGCLEPREAGLVPLLALDDAEGVPALVVGVDEDEVGTVGGRQLIANAGQRCQYKKQRPQIPFHTEASPAGAIMNISSAGDCMVGERGLPSAARVAHGEWVGPCLDSFESGRRFLFVSMRHPVCWPAAALMARRIYLLRRDIRDSSGAQVALMGITAMQWVEGMLWLDGPKPHGALNQLLTVG